ncbi:stage III sporulation protein AG [Amphibacillus sp. MSJ-3]|uniref:stage III sporulation protein AG n=1 Tax=Amphibacillus sp. MSJ-3 TaxID=2841505 RepID=UPI001C0F2063|nr:stage III sporulation protein AG [Amphibacillus sp. MSJ-3]MBU5594798.1 stage III sporulation protein AG [Amphibacillus sp. MSJ-3]
MDNPLKKVFDWLKNLQSNRKLTKSNYLIILACLGIILLIVSQLFSSPDQTVMDDGKQYTTEAEKNVSSTNKNEIDPLSELEQTYQADLSAMLEKISGISEVEVMVNLDATGEKVYEKNLIVGTQTTVESDQGGGTRNIDDLTEEQQVVIIRQGDQEVPLIVQSKKPTVRGVLVVANGVEQIKLKQWATEAVSRVLNVPPHRISIMPRSKGES